MKRLLASVLASVCVFSAVSCSSPVKSQSSRQNNLSNPFTAKMSVSLDKMTADGTITRSSDSKWEAEFDSPNTLSGVKLTFEDNIVKASYKGLDFSVPKSALPVKAMLTNLIDEVDSLAIEEELHGSEAEGLLHIEGSLDGGEYSLCVDKDGYIRTFEMPNNLLKIAFSEVSASGTPISPAESETTVCTTEITAVETTVTTAC